MQFIYVSLRNARKEMLTALESEKRIKIYPNGSTPPSPSEVVAEIYVTDAGYNEDISLLSNAIGDGVMGIYGAEGKKWLAEYMNESDKTKRLQMFRSLHKKALELPSVVPITASPYVALVRKGWKSGTSSKAGGLNVSHSKWRAGHASYS